MGGGGRGRPGVRGEGTHGRAVASHPAQVHALRRVGALCPTHLHPAERDDFCCDPWPRGVPLPCHHHLAIATGTQLALKMVVLPRLLHYTGSALLLAEKRPFPTRAGWSEGNKEVRVVKQAGGRPLWLLLAFTDTPYSVSYSSVPALKLPSSPHARQSPKSAPYVTLLCQRRHFAPK